jgi:uroporphyrinogen-III synthase
VVSVMNSVSLLPLQGRTVLVTRTEQGNAVEREKLEALGAKVVEFPGIEIVEPIDQQLLTGAFEELANFDWIVFTSANGVKLFFEKLAAMPGLKAKFACVGPKTQKELGANGFEASFVPTEFLTDALGRQMASEFDLRKKKILLARAEGARKNIAQILRNAGAEVLEVPIYKIAPRERVDMDRARALLDGVTDVTLTSPSTVDAFVSNFGANEITARKIKVHAIGPVTADRAHQYGLEVATTASVHTIDGLVDALVRTVKVG